MTAQGREAPLRAVTWNLAGLAEDSLEPFLDCGRMKNVVGDVMFLQETLRNLNSYYLV